MRSWLKSKLLYRYIISYLFVFLVPFLIMSAIIYLNSVSSLREEIEQSNINKLEQVENITKERMKELETIAARISYDPRLTPYMISHGYYSSEGIEELKKYKANSSIIEELFIYYYQQEKLYSTTGSYTLDSLMFTKYSFNNWNKDKFLNELHTTLPFSRRVENVIINNEQEENIIAYFFPISPNSPNPYGTVMYFIKESTMKDLIANILGEFQGNAYILNEDNQIIASSVNDLEVKSEEINFSSYVKENSSVENIKINGKDYSLVSVTSNVSGWKFITLMDADQFFERLGNTTMLIVLLFLILLIMGFILAVVLAKYQYKPIQRLFESVKSNSNKQVNANGDNELEAIRKTITTVFEDHELLNERMYKQRPFARDQFLAKLLKGDFNDENEITTLSNSLNIEMNDGELFVTIVYFEKDQFGEANIAERENMFNLLSSINLDGAVAYGIDLLYRDAMALVVSMETIGEDDNQNRKHLVTQIKQYIKDTTDIEPTIGVGGLYDEITKINRSYIEALATIEHKYFYPEGSIIYFEEISTSKEKALGYPKEEQMKLVQSIKQGDKAVAEETMRKVFDYLSSSDLSIHVLKAICFDIINTTVKTISEVGLETSVEDFNQMVDFHTIEQLHEQLSVIVLKACEEVDDRKESHNTKLRNDLLEYIRTNYKEYELSLERIAIEFKLSVSYISRFIKEQTGVTFRQYVQQLRMDEVKRQLKTTDKPIKEIVVDVGYKDVANFTRKFKQEVGVTPGQYRNLNG